MAPTAAPGGMTAADVGEVYPAPSPRWGASLLRYTDCALFLAMQVVTALKELWPGCTMVTGRPRHSPSNGGNERFNRTIVEKVRLFCCEHNTPNWPLAAQLAIWQYNTGFHSAIQQVRAAHPAICECICLIQYL